MTSNRTINCQLILYYPSKGNKTIFLFYFPIKLSEKIIYFQISEKNT